MSLVIECRKTFWMMQRKMCRRNEKFGIVCALINTHKGFNPVHVQILWVFNHCYFDYSKYI